MDLFKGKHCQKMTIAYFIKAAGDDPVNKKTLTDVKSLESVLGYLAQIPNVGTEFKKMAAPSSRLTCRLSCDGEDLEIEYYDNKLRSPEDGSFYDGVAAEGDLERFLRKQLGI